MRIPRDIYNASPPERRSRIANNPTLLYSWWCTVFSIVIIGFRVCGRYIRNERLFREDKIMAWSILPLAARMACVHVVLIYGTNNVDVSKLTDPLSIRHREIGSQCVLAARIFYAMFVWMAKLTVSEFLKRLTARFWKKSYESVLRGIRIFLVVTFIAVVIATLSECQPFTHYWQVVPDPGPRCRQGYAQLLTMGVTDIVTDILLVTFPIPIIFRSAMSFKRKLSLTALFSLSLILIAVTGARMPLVIHRRGLQQFRTVWASTEVLSAAIVANAIILGSFLRDRGVKKAKFKAPSTTDSMERRASARRLTDQTCSSDENLARSLGFRTKPELAEKRSSLPRPAPVADIGLLAFGKQDGPFTNSTWQFPQEELGMFNRHEDAKLTMTDIQDPMPSPQAGRRVPWVDAGGLLDNAAVTPSPTDSVLAHDFASQPRRNSRSSIAFLQNGRSYPPPARRSSRLSQYSEDYEMSTFRSSYQLQDLGGLLTEERENEGEDRPSTAPHSMPAAGLMQHQRRQSTSVHRFSTRSSHDVPSLEDPSGRLSNHTTAPIQRTTTQTSYDVPSLKDAGGLLS